MRANQRKDDGRSFDQALMRYRRARAALDRAHTDKAVERVDVAIDGVLVVVSRSPADVGTKLRILREEYGVDVQPRHAAGLYGDVGVLEGYVA